MVDDLLTALLLNDADLQVEAIDVDEERITLQVSSIRAAVACPECDSSTQRTHSQYTRTLADLPWADKAACLRLRVRRFFCDQPSCPRTTFTERLPEVAPTYARRTPRLAVAQRDIGLALGGAAGSRLAAKQHMATSRNTVLRLIRQASLPATTTPRVVGIDDWAQRKGQRYGTIIVDLETRQPLDVLDDRFAATVEQWLRAHPTVEIISRDRAEAYAAGASAGAPTAIQVADRWHLLKNLREAVEQELVQSQLHLRRAMPEASPESGNALPKDEKCTPPTMDAASLTAATPSVSADAPPLRQSLARLIQ